MKKSKSEITQTMRGQLKYYLSVLEKENDSGIMFNERVFFLLAAHHIGYISDVKMGETPDQINFEKPKTTVLLTNIKSIVLNAPQLSIKFYLIDGNKKSERTWLLRTENEALAKAWYDLLQKEKITSTSSKAISPKRSQMVEPPPLPSPKKIEIEKKKDLEIVRPIELTSNVKATKEYKEVGIGMSPKNAQVKKIGTPKQSPEEKLNSIMKEQPKPPKPQSPRRAKQQPKPSGSTQMAKSRNLMIIAPQSPLNTTIRSKEPQPSQPKPQQTPKVDMKPILVNTKYLNNNKAVSVEPVKGKDYLERTHDLIKSFEEDRPNRSKEQGTVLTEVREVKEVEAQNLSLITPIKVKLVQEQSGLPWTYRYIKHGHLIFPQFQQATQELMVQLVHDQYLSKKQAKFKPKLIRSSIHYFDIEDVQVKLALIGLEDINNSMQNIDTQRVCNKKAIKILQNEFNNFKALYEYLGTEEKLRVPLISLCEYSGFLALFKASSKQLKKSIRFKEIQYQLSQLQKRSKIHSNFIDSISNVIIQLDESYYDSIHKGEPLNFNLYLIQEIDDFLLPDLIADSPNEKLLILRKELLDNYRIDSGAIRKDLSLFKQAKGGYSKELQTFSKNILVAISQAIVQMDSFSAYFLNSSQFSRYLHSRGINLRYLGHLYENLKTAFQKRFVMTEIAVRSCKTLLRKTLQDVISSEEFKHQQDLHFKICDFLNCIMGNTFETAAIWKVLSTHAKAYYGFELNFDLIDRGHFVISLIENCRLDVHWEKIRPEEAFKSNIFFSEKNLVGLRTVSKSYPALFHPHYATAMKVLEREEVYSGFEALVDHLNLKTQPIPAQLSLIQSEIRRYLSFFVSPSKADSEFPHLSLYDCEDVACPSRLRFDLLLMRIKWALKQKQRQQYIKVCDYYIRIATKYFGQFHPIYSQLYELFSAYHLNSSEYEDAITFAKSSLVNMLKICGTGHEKTSECYYHLALCYIKCGKREEGISHIKKSLAIFESSGKTETVPYAVMQVKLALLYLNQNQVEECLRHVSNSYAVFEGRAGESPSGFEDEVTECLEMLNRCYQLLQERGQAKALLEQCQARLKRTTRPHNLQKILKIYLSPILSNLPPVHASNYLDIISQLSIDPSPPHCEASYKLLRERILEDTFLPNLNVYLHKLESIEQHIREQSLLSEWANFSQIFQRETVKDFLNLTVQLLTFLGEGFISGSLREAL